MGVGRHNHDYAGPGEAHLGHGEGCGHYHVSELDGLPRRAGLNDLSKIDRAASTDFTAPVAGLYVRQFQQGRFLCVARHRASPPIRPVGETTLTANLDNGRRLSTKLFICASLANSHPPRGGLCDLCMSGRAVAALHPSTRHVVHRA